MGTLTEDKRNKFDPDPLHIIPESSKQTGTNLLELAKKTDLSGVVPTPNYKGGIIDRIMDSTRFTGNPERLAAYDAQVANAAKLGFNGTEPISRPIVNPNGTMNYDMPEITRRGLAPKTDKILNTAVVVPPLGTEPAGGGGSSIKISGTKAGPPEVSKGWKAAGIGSPDEYRIDQSMGGVDTRETLRREVANHAYGNLLYMSKAGGLTPNADEAVIDPKTNSPIVRGMDNRKTLVTEEANPWKGTPVDTLHIRPVGGIAKEKNTNPFDESITRLQDEIANRSGGIKWRQRELTNLLLGKEANETRMGIEKEKLDELKRGHNIQRDQFLLQLTQHKDEKTRKATEDLLTKYGQYGADKKSLNIPATVNAFLENNVPLGEHPELQSMAINQYNRFMRFYEKGLTHDAAGNPLAVPLKPTQESKNKAWQSFKRLYDVMDRSGELESFE